VLCNATGHEGTRSFRNLQQLAIRLSQDGFEVVRFDFACTGNSTGRDELATLEQWRSDIAAVVDRIRHDHALDPSHRAVSVLGVRLGATLLAQTPLSGIDKAVLWDPVFCGKSYLDGLRMQHRYQLGSLTRFLKFRKAEPFQFMGYACSEFMQNEISSIELNDSIRLQSASRWIVTSKDYLPANQPSPGLPDWSHVACQDEIYWNANEYSQVAFSSPNSSRAIASLFANGVA
jgi:pimeloyl-ACP methyl ester carboxylesterase